MKERTYISYVIKTSYEYWYAVPEADYLNHIDLSKLYRYRIKIFNVTDRPVADLRGMEDWCNKKCGDLEEDDSNSPWQISREREDSRSKPTFTCTLIFYFTNKQDAMLFRLSWA